MESSNGQGSVRSIRNCEARTLRRDYPLRFFRNGFEIHATCARGNVPPMTQDSERSFIRWIPVVVPLSGLVLVLGVYLIAAEVLARVV